MEDFEFIFGDDEFVVLESYHSGKVCICVYEDDESYSSVHLSSKQTAIELANKILELAEGMELNLV